VIRRLWLLCAALCLTAAGSAPARAANLLDEIKKRGVLRIGTDATYPPFENKIGDRFEGLDIDLGEEIGKELGVRVQWETINFDGLLAAVQTGKYDIAISDVVITDERKKTNAFSRPYFLAGETIARRKGDERVRTSADLKDKTVCVQLGTTGEKAVEGLGLPESRIRKFDTIQEALLEVTNGRADAVVADEPALKFILAKDYPALELTGGVFVHENYAVVLPQNEPELLAAVNAALDRILTDGRYAKIYERWIEEPYPAHWTEELDRLRGEGTTVGTRATGSAFTIRWELLRVSLPYLLRGAGTTLYLAAVALLIGVPCGLLIALVRLSRFPPLVLLATVYVEVIRGTPLLMQIFVVYFVLPSVGIKLPQMAAAVAALSLNGAAYISEIFRAGIESIDSGQMEAARALGMDYAGAMRWVILPQTVRRTLPPLTNEAVALLKDTSLVAIIGLAELTRVGREQSSNAGSPVTIYLAVALIYLVMTLPLTYLVRVLEVRWRPVSRPVGAKVRKLL
jgi:His/Glu/Gln/Arg/opine family amino acid ABC transporter permease subunit